HSRGPPLTADRATRGRPAGSEFGLGFQLIGNAEFLDYACNVDAGCAATGRIGINDGLRVKQGAFEILDGRDTRLRGARRDHDADAGLRDCYLTPLVDSAACHE